MDKQPIASQTTPPVQFVGGYRRGFAVVPLAETIGEVEFLNAHGAGDPRPCQRSPGERRLALISGGPVDPMAR